MTDHSPKVRPATPKPEAHRRFKRAYDLLKSEKNSQKKAL